MSTPGSSIAGEVVLVTGAAGFVGAELAAAALRAGAREVRALDSRAADAAAIARRAAADRARVVALACDVRYATTAARLNAQSIRIGTTGADIGTSYFLPRICGLSIASELMLTGRFIDGSRAERVGLVSQCFDDAAAMADVEREVDLGRGGFDDHRAGGPCAIRVASAAASWAGAVNAAARHA